MGELWRLYKGDVLLGEITIYDMDWPWLHGRFISTDAFTAVKPWFDETLRLLEAEEFGEAFDAAYAPIEEQLTLESPTGSVDQFLLHVQGDRAWFRS
ncbi:hypothetical protein ACIRF8_35685 [Streptomyces sp. NPDC102406]|uniref:hypothetical protein n=1 Tax=Streptomyces sp. NPDC102406 TaxID=3366171 RepID=UPI003803847F